MKVLLTHRDPLRADRGPRANTLQTIDYDRVVHLQSLADNPQAIDDRTKLHRPVLDLVVRADYEHVLDGLVGADRAVIDKECVVLLVTHEPYTGKQPGGKGAVMIVQLGASTNRARLRINLV